MARPTLTGVKIRHRFDAYETIGLADPAYGVPEQNVPMIWDSTALMYRPFSSVLAADIGNVILSFAGFSDGFVQPDPGGTPCPVTIVRSGIVEVFLDVATAITTEDQLLPTAGTVVSNDTFTLAQPPAAGILKVVKICSCGDCRLEPCPPDAAAAAARGSSPSDPAVYPLRRMAWAYFNVGFSSVIAALPPG